MSHMDEVYALLLGWCWAISHSRRRDVATAAVRWNKYGIHLRRGALHSARDVTLCGITIGREVVDDYSASDCSLQGQELLILCI